MRKYIIAFSTFLFVHSFVSAQVLTYANNRKVDVSKVMNPTQRIRSIVDELETGYDMYYLIQQRDGTDLKVERKQVFFCDIAQPDVASEGFIRFVDNDTQLVGLLNEYGEVALPAMYTALTNVQNGVIVALVDGSRENIGSKGDAHWVLVGGDTVLLNTKNEILVRNFSEPNMELDYYSMQITNTPIQDINYNSYLGVNGQYYNFLNLEKSFRSFVIEEFLPSTKSDAWHSYLSDNVEVNIEIKNNAIGDYIHVGKKELLTDYKSKVTKAFEVGRKQVAAGHSDELKLSVDNWSGYVDEATVKPDELNLYFNADQTWREELFPLFELIVQEKKDGQQRNNHFDFYRDINGKMVLYKTTIRSNFF